MTAKKRLGEILVDAGVLDERTLRAALADQKKSGAPLGKILVERGIAEEGDLTQALSRQLGVPEVNLDETELDTHALELVSLEEARKHQLFAFRLEARFLDVALADPTNAENARFLEELAIRSGKAARAHLAGATMIERAIDRGYG